MSRETGQNEDLLGHLVQLANCLQQCFAIAHCQKRSPEGLDTIFDNQPPATNHQILLQVSLSLKIDIDTLAWFCGYLASEINCTADNHKEHHPIIELSYLLITHIPQVIQHKK
jgi:hypothetical protein